MKMADLPGILLNRDILISLIGDDQETIKSFAIDFLGQATESLTDLVSAFNENNYNQIKESSHFLKSSAQAIGAEQLAYLLQELENTALKCNKVHCKKLIVLIQVSIKEVYGEIHNGG
jgi:HPt (histidine-containing phosphotransfer) domain-containing protein